MLSNSLSSKENEELETLSYESKEIEKTTEPVSKGANYKVEQTAPTETYRSFHIAHIVPDLFKNEDSFSRPTATAVEEKHDLSANRGQLKDICHEPIMQVEQPLLGRLDTQDVKLDTDNSHILSGDIDKITKQDESLEKTEVKIPIGAPVIGFRDKETVKPEHLAFSHEEKPFSEMDENYKLSDERMPLLSPDKPLAVSLVELDHSYGLTIPEELTQTIEEPELFDKSVKDTPLPNDREITESPVVDIVTVEPTLSLLPAPELTSPKPQFPVRSFEADDELVYEFHRLGIDAEDCYYLNVGFEQLQQVGSDSVVDAHWSSHPYILLNTLSQLNCCY